MLVLTTKAIWYDFDPPASFMADSGEISAHPVSRALFVMNTAAGIVYADLVGETAAYANCSSTDIILVTREHIDHFSEELLSDLVGEKAQQIAIPAVHIGCQCCCG
ncbi:MAG: hypothetical protein AB8B94_10495 [Hyphomicrobiales bacterium]